MGTSSARRAPVGKPWRTAKVIASRFASGKEANPPQAREVVARYLGALQSQTTGSGEPSGHILGEVLRTAVNLGNFYLDWHHNGLAVALDRLGSAGELASPDELIPALLDNLAGPGSTLDEAAARAALSEHLATVWPTGKNHDPKKTSLRRGPDPAGGVGHFLGQALHRKLISDLGETLEYHAPDIQGGLERQEEVYAAILAAAAALALPAFAGEAISLEQAAALLASLILSLGGDRDR